MRVAILTASLAALALGAWAAEAAAPIPPKCSALNTQRHATLYTEGLYPATAPRAGYIRECGPGRAVGARWDRAKSFTIDGGNCSRGCLNRRSFGLMGVGGLRGKGLWFRLAPVVTTDGRQRWYVRPGRKNIMEGVAAAGIQFPAQRRHGHHFEGSKECDLLRRVSTQGYGQLDLPLAMRVSLLPAGLGRAYREVPAAGQPVRHRLPARVCGNVAESKRLQSPRCHSSWITTISRECRPRTSPRRTREISSCRPSTAFPSSRTGTTTRATRRSVSLRASGAQEMESVHRDLTGSSRTRSSPSRKMPSCNSREDSQSGRRVRGNQCLQDDSLHRPRRLDCFGCRARSQRRSYD